MNGDLQEMYREAMETTIPEATVQPTVPCETPVSAATPVPTATREPKLLSSYQHIGGTVLPEIKKLREKNPDTVAWLSIPGGIAELPIVYRNNTYYLNHDFYGRRNSSGTLFLDEMHPLMSDTQYLVVHGHNMHDGSMFGLLSHYMQPGYMERYSVVYLSTPYRQEVYEVIGVLYLPIDVRAEGYVPYVGTRKFEDVKHFRHFADSIRENALYWKEGVEMLPSDALLALSTCYDEYRIVVMCRRI
jgi:sortase B